MTTAAPHQPDKGDQGPGAAYNASAKFYTVYRGDVAAPPVLGISHLGYDRRHTSAADLNSFFPLASLKQAQAEGRIGALAPHFQGAPTNRSQRATLEQDGPDILAGLRADGAEAAVIVAT